MTMAAVAVAVLFAAQTGGAVEPPLPFMARAELWVLNGRTLPADYRQELLAMPPQQRIQALVFLRRAGLLNGQSWTIDDLLRPAPPPAGDRQP